jgi:hypothetical protein
MEARMHPIARLLVVAALPAVACTGVGPFSPTVEEVAVMADSPILGAVGSQTHLHLVFPDGSSTDLPSVVWTSSAPAVATVDQTGTVSAVSHGMATITAIAGDLTASTTITVDVDIRTTVSVRSSGSDPVGGNDSATVTVTVRAN